MSISPESQLALMIRKFKRNRMAIIGLFLVVGMYLILIPAEFFAPYDLLNRHKGFNYVPPQRVRFWDSEEGRLHLRPFVYGLEREFDSETLELKYEVNREEKYFIKLFVHGDEYQWGPFAFDIHLFGVEKGGKLFLLGTDRQGRDMLSRILIGGRVSMTVGLVAVVLSVAIGSTLGVISGYYGGFIDQIIQRATEVSMSFPKIPIWMALAAAVPPEWNSVQVYFMVTIIFSLILWARLARQVRGKILALRDQDFVMAAKSIGSNTPRVLFFHLLPMTLSHIIVVGTLLIPHIIITETILSFLGLGIRPPMTSWGVLLREAQRVSVLASHPWLTIPAIFVVIALLGFNFLGDGLRDAADPYST